MHTECLPERTHPHTFGQEKRRPGERRTWIVIGVTTVMMVAEIIAGVAFGSMALLADGLHMASHTVALGITAFAYAYARRHAYDARFCFGTGKVNALGGFTGAVLLALFALFMAWESFQRFRTPVAIAFDQAIFVAVLGLGVNVISALILNVRGHEHGAHGAGEHAHDHGHPHHHDHNLRSAYLHVLADALTSVAAIIALLAGKYMNLGWMDPAMGIVGALLVARWSVGLLRETSHVLLDHQAPEPVRETVRRAVEDDSLDRVSDLHIWSVGPGVWAAELTILTDAPRPVEDYKQRIMARTSLAHLTVEIQHCPHAEDDAPAGPATAEAG